MSEGSKFEYKIYYENGEIVLDVSRILNDTERYTTGMRFNMDKEHLKFWGDGIVREVMRDVIWVFDFLYNKQDKWFEERENFEIEKLLKHTHTICFKTKHNDDIPKAADVALLPWQNKILKILEDEDIDYVEIKCERIEE